MFGLGQTVELVEGKAAADFDSPMIFFDSFRRRVRRALRHCLELDEEVTDRVSQVRLIVLGRQHVIGASVANRLGDVGLRAHRVDRDDASFQGEGTQQFRNGGLFVRLLGCRPLSEHQPRAAAKALTRCSGVVPTPPSVGWSCRQSPQRHPTPTSG